MLKYDEINNFIVDDREYFQSKVMPILLNGLDLLTKERPDKPIEFLAYYLLKEEKNINK